MDQNQLRSLLEQVREGAVDVDGALERLRHLPFEDLGFAKVDHHRALRHGMPEVVFGLGKTPEQIAQIALQLLERSQQRAGDARHRGDGGKDPQGTSPDAEYFPLSGAIRVWRDRTVHGKGNIAVVCAGTSDIPVAEEAQVTAEVMGNNVDVIHDIGVAGIHRLMSNRERLDAGARDRRVRGHGGRAAERGGRAGVLPGDRGADQHRLRRELSWTGGAAGDAEQLREQCDGGQHRQRLRRGLRREPDQPAVTWRCRRTR